MSHRADLRDRANRCEQPLSAFLELTYACSWRCVFCFNPRHHDVRGLSASEWRGVLDGLRELGTLHVTLTGGEPLAHREFFEIAEAVRSRFFVLRVFTNGSMVDAKAASRIAALYPAGVELSLHGANARSHDEVTGRTGSFEMLLRAVRELQERGVPLLLKTPLTRHNELEIGEMAGLARRLEVSYQIDPRMTPRDDGDPSPLTHSSSELGVQKAREALGHCGPVAVERKRALGAPHCALGHSTLAVDPEGNVFPCIQWRRNALGNVRDTPIAELWRNSPVRRAAAQVSVEAKDRSMALGSSVAGGALCPALDLHMTGRPAGSPGSLDRDSARALAG